ncbi:MAG: suppressor of fused domain protein [Arenimonas sp.]|nr:suppressor of fused domain protein [Arenimonas sp.]
MYLESRLDVGGANFVVIHGFLTIPNLGTMNVLFNLPTKTSSVFLAIAENSFAEVARILANVEDYQRATGRQIGFGETMGLDGTWPSQLTQEASALIFLPCSVSLDLQPLTDDFLLDDETVTFALVVPVTDEDIRIRHEQGLNVLFGKWDEVAKKILM